MATYTATEHDGSCSVSVSYLICHSSLTLDSLEKAKEQPQNLAQETIVANLNPVEAARLDKLRNIGIAVSQTVLFAMSSTRH